MVEAQSIWDDPAVVVTEVKFGLIAVADGCSQDTSSQGEYYYYNLTKIYHQNGSDGEERNRGSHLNTFEHI